MTLGTMTWGEQNTEAEAHQQLAYALEVGVNAIDTGERIETYLPLLPSTLSCYRGEGRFAVA